MNRLERVQLAKARRLWPNLKALPLIPVESFNQKQLIREKDTCAVLGQSRLTAKLRNVIAPCGFSLLKGIPQRVYRKSDIVEARIALTKNGASFPEVKTMPAFPKWKS